MTTPTLIAPTLTNFIVPTDKKYGDQSFNLTNPTSNSLGAFTFTSKYPAIASINGNVVTIVNSGTTEITASQDPSGVYSRGSITSILNIGVKQPTISDFIIPNKYFNDVSFNLTDPSSNSTGSFTFESSNTGVATISGREVTIRGTGTSYIVATQRAFGNYTSGTITSTLTVITSILRPGIQRQIDLSWNTPINNGSSIKNYFFSSEERSTPSGNIISTSYDSYALPVPYSSTVLSNVLSSSNRSITLALDLSNTITNYFDLSYNAEIELKWKYNSIILDICSNSQTIMSLSIYKRNIVTDTRIYVLRNYQRIYDSSTNCLGAMPQNSNRTITDIFNVTFDSIVTRDLLYLSKNDVIEGTIALSDFNYYPSTATAFTSDQTLEYNISILGLRLAPYHFPITRDFTSLSSGKGNAGPETGFVVSTVTAALRNGIYYMPKMTRPLTSFNEAKISLSLIYGVDLSAINLSSLSLQNITQLNVPFQLRVRCYSRSFKQISSTIIDASYNTSSIDEFVTNSMTYPSYNTYLLFDISRNYTAEYNAFQRNTVTNLLPVNSMTFDISNSSTFPVTASPIDPAHTQFVYLFSLTVTDPSYNAVFQTNPFQLNILSNTFAPRNFYRFSSPDPTAPSSYELSSSTNTLYDIGTSYYIDNTPFYRFYNLTNGNYYTYRIAANNLSGTGPFSSALTRRCGSVPNKITNTVGTLDYFTESERLSNRIDILWKKPEFSGYEIKNFIIQINVDISGRWLNILDYSADISYNTLTFDRFEDIIVPVTDESVVNYRYNTEKITYRSPISTTGPLINGNKYYIRMRSVNELGYSAYSDILTGIPITRPASTLVNFVGVPVVGNNLVYLTWQIPSDDGGAPILNYIIDYQEIVGEVNGGTLVGEKFRYNQNAQEPPKTVTTYPKDQFVAIYNSLKDRNTLSTLQLSKIDASRNYLSNFIIPPVPITLKDSDKNLGETVAANKNVVLTYQNSSFTYISDELTQNVFDISNIQLKWYYFLDGGGWPINTSVTFRLSIKGHLEHVGNNRALDISNIFYIQPSSRLYTVTSSNMSVNGNYNYIDYNTGNVITDNVVPKIFIPTLPRIDSSNNLQRYKLRLEYTLSEHSSSLYKFIMYSGPIIINGTAPIRTIPGLGLNTKFSIKLTQNALCPLDNTKTYRFTVTPFNIADYFLIEEKNTVDVVMGIQTSEPVYNVSYSIVQESSGGRVVLNWNYISTAEYYVTIEIASPYLNANFSNEYPLLQQDEGPSLSILTRKITPTLGLATYSIPSIRSDDITSGNAQRYLKPGRGYIIKIAPVKLAEVNNKTIPLIAPFVSMTPTNVFIVPFTTPLSPVSFGAISKNSIILLSWKLPNLNEDPNYYVTDAVSSFYTYRYYSIELRDLSGSNPSTWTTVTQNSIPSNSGDGYTLSYTAADLINEHDYQFRVRLIIQNSYNNQVAYSDYTYITELNNVFVDNTNNVVRPSQYPFKPSGITYLGVSRPEARQLQVEFNQPSYNGNATSYECVIEYYNVVANEWIDIFNMTTGISNLNDNTSILTSGKLVVSTIDNALTSIIIKCKSVVLNYSIRLRVIGKISGVAEPYRFPLLSYSDYSPIQIISF